MKKRSATMKRHSDCRSAVLTAALCVAVVVVGMGRPAQATCLGDGNVNCNGQGTCRLTDGAFFCDCFPGFEGPACERRTCPTGKAWVGDADATGQSHFDGAVCSNAGTCDTTTGLCVCNAAYTGDACQRLVCPGANSVTCSGHGMCVTIEEHAHQYNKTDTQQAYLYTAWDRSMSTMCECDAGYTGYDCSIRTCPFGDDPLSRGTLEIQSIRTTATHMDETQRIVVSTSSGTDTDEQQTYSFYDTNTGPFPLTGFYTLTFTTSLATCTLCSTYASETTAKINVNADISTVKSALEALSNIDTVTVERNANGGSLEGYAYTITFSGTGVGGDVPTLSMTRSIYGDGPGGNLPSESVAGSEPTGSFTLTLDDSNSNPAGTVGSDTSSSISVAASATDLQTAIQNMNNVGAVTVTRTLATNAPTITFDIQFTEDLGNVDEFACTYAAGSCTPSTPQEGYYLGGTFDLTVGSFGTVSSVSVTELPGDLRTKIEALDTMSRMGDIEVTRSPYVPVAAEYTNTYQWSITFYHQTSNFADLVVDDTGVTGAGGTGAATVGTASSQLTGGEQDAANVQVNEVQLLECTCTGTCGGTTKLSYKGQHTTALSYNAATSDVKNALEALREIDGVQVVYFGASNAMCTSGGTTFAITFTHNAGDLPALEVEDFAITSDTSISFAVVAEGETNGLKGGISRQGSRDWQECNGRGQCDRTVGRCMCYDGWSSGDGAALDVDASPGFRNDCGYRATNMTACDSSVAPGGFGDGASGPCSGRGTCSGSPQYVCTCNSGYYGGACEFVTCPMHYAFSDTPTADDTAHANAQCSNRGICNEEVGTCECHAGFSSDGNRCSTVDCKSSCNGHGTCLTNTALANLTTDADSISVGGYLSGWEEDKFKGCSCNTVYSGDFEWGFSTYQGANCDDYLSCPVGDDPDTPNQVSEVQHMSCTHTGGTFTLSFRGQTTGHIAYNHVLGTGGAGDLEKELEALSTIRNVTVTSVTTSASHICDGAVTAIEFVTEGGDVPLLVFNEASLTGGTMTMSEDTKGTREAIECSNRGWCDTSNGQCTCALQYGSSDGQGNSGRLGECGYLHAHQGSNGKFTPYPG